MSFNGAGVFQVNSSGQPVVTGTTITSTAFNALTADVATGLSTTICRDGQSTVLANIPFGGFKLTNIGAPTTAGDALRYGTAVPVGSGGTGVTTLTGIPLGNGTSAFTVATAGTDYAKPSVTSGWTVNQFFQGSTTSPAISLVNAIEGVNLTGAGASGAITIHPSTASIYYSNANATGNWTINITFSAGTTMDTVMSTGQGITVAHLASQGASPFFNTAVTIDGAPAAFIGWQGGTPVAGHAFAVDVYSYTVIKVGAATFVVLASQTPFT